MTDEWQPAFPGQREPFEPGNTAAVRHGAQSERYLAPLAAEIASALLGNPELPGYLREPAYAATVAAWARAEARVEMLDQWVSAQPMGEQVKYLDRLRQWEVTAMNLRGRLGLDPLSRARLERDRATSGAVTVAAMAGLATLTARGGELAARDLAALDAGEVEQ